MIIILLCSLPNSYDHLITALTYEKDTINLDVITTTFSSHFQSKQSAEERTQRDNQYVKGGQDHGRNKGSGDFGKKRSKSRNHKIDECYNCKQIGHWKKDYPNR